MKTGVEIAVWAGWLLCIISLVSVGRHSATDFQGIGQSRRRWAWISLLGIIPYLGIFISVAYFFAVSIRLPEKERVPGPCSHHGRRKCRGASLSNVNTAAATGGRTASASAGRTRWASTSLPAAPTAAAAGNLAAGAMATGYNQGTSSSDLVSVEAPAESRRRPSGARGGGTSQAQLPDPATQTRCRRTHGCHDHGSALGVDQVAARRAKRSPDRCRRCRRAATLNTTSPRPAFVIARASRRRRHASCSARNSRPSRPAC